MHHLDRIDLIDSLLNISEALDKISRALPGKEAVEIIQISDVLTKTCLSLIDRSNEDIGFRVHDASSMESRKAPVYRMPSDSIELRT